MDKKVLLVLVDGLRPDSIPMCGNDYLLKLAEKGRSTMSAITVDPSVTLPCHFSLFCSTTPERHGIESNDWHPMVRPIDSLFDVVSDFRGVAASFYNWEQLRDLSKPGSLAYNFYISESVYENTDRILTDDAIEYVRERKPDFAFLYLGETDEWGHGYGWNSPEYLKSVANASECIKDIVESLSDEYTVFVTADHGGHGRGHGTQMPEDITIPLIAVGKDFTPGDKFENASIIDIAPTILKLMGLPNPQYWEGKSIL